MKKILIDMDGTIANLYDVNKWLEKLCAENPSPYIEAKPLCDMTELSKIITILRNQGHKIVIVSWTAKNSTEHYKLLTRRAKREWLNQYNIECDEVHLIQYGTNKAKFCDKGYDNILIDDDPNVRALFEKTSKTGQTVDPTKTNIVNYLSTLI